ncbi:MAG: hypothetical protein JRI94_14370 [Deltaproteobacteria bacterium]|nr:hypothetical protein [Deltaproteobacteria bacterium]MBW2115853.1 hypothetical protein [Deltaproteobacteria bacterium]
MNYVFLRLANGRPNSDSRNLRKSTKWDLGDVHKKVNNSARAIGNGERRVERIDNRGRRAEDKNAGMLGFRD